MASTDEIWLVDFGEPVRSEPAFIRPALVVSTDALHRTGLPVVLVVPGTTRRLDLVTRVEVEPDEDNGLAQVTYLACDQIRSVGTHRLVRPLGRVAVTTATAVRVIIGHLLGESPPGRPGTERR